MNRDLLFEYLRQRVELGDKELYLDSLTANDFIRLLNNPAQSRSQSQSQSQSSPSHSHSQSQSLSPSFSELSPKTSHPQLDILAQQASACTACGLHATRRNAVFARGNPLARLMVIGEAPGEEEDKTGLPFVGRAGKLLDVLLASIGFPRDSVYICNVLKCRPPNNRNPMPNEVASCNGFLRSQIDIVAPKVLLAVGKFAAQTLVQSEESIGRLRGQVHQYNSLPVVVTYHPAYLLRSPQATRIAWHDFQLVRKILDEQT